MGGRTSSVRLHDAHIVVETVLVAVHERIVSPSNVHAMRLGEGVQIVVCRAQGGEGDGARGTRGGGCAADGWWELGNYRRTSPLAAGKRPRGLFVLPLLPYPLVTARSRQGAKPCPDCHCHATTRSGTASVA